MVGFDSITKNEAIKALSEGGRVRHGMFADGEWMEEHNHSYIFENGMKCSVKGFWMCRKQEWWDSGWHIIK